MNELDTLRALRDAVKAPTPTQLAPAAAALNRTMTGSPRDRCRRRVPWILGAVAGVAALTLATGNAAIAAESKRTGSLLQIVAGETIKFSDPDPGQFLLARTHAKWPTETTRPDGSLARGVSEQVLEVYKPADPNEDWVFYREWNGQDEEATDAELLRALDGDFYSDYQSAEFYLDDIPHSSGREALAYFDARYFGGNSSRDEDNFDRITDVLTTGLVSAQLRAALFEGLARIPGVSSTADVPNLAGQKGVAIGRTEILRGGERTEIIVDPDTGLVIGERTLRTFAAFGFGVNEVIASTAVETRVVEESR